MKKKEIYEQLYKILDEQNYLANQMKDNVGKFNKLMIDSWGYQDGEKILSNMEFLDSVLAYAENGESITKSSMIHYLEKALEEEE